jgi:hypothetical protein
MERRTFIKNSALTGIGLSTVHADNLLQAKPQSDNKNCLAITMWEFSWLERRWPGAGYEDWDFALSELKNRGYNSVRIDAFPHLIYKDAHKEFLIEPHWNTQDWGSPAINRITLQPHFINFISKCREYDIKIGLSTWWRKDTDESYKVITTPQKLGEVWLSVLNLIEENDLMDQILYLDLSNEWPLDVWTPFKTDIGWWDSDESVRWMNQSIEMLRNHYPEIPYTFSFTGEVNQDILNKGDLSMLDFYEPHIWMVNGNKGEFYKEAGYNYERFSDEGYKNMALKGEKLYREKENYWKDMLISQIEWAAEWSRKHNKPLITTECWGVIDYKDWPLLEWDWVKELCDLGTREAIKTGQWAAIATSNFCGPQFVGMWRDFNWHKDLTDNIRKTEISKSFNNSKLVKRI